MKCVSGTVAKDVWKSRVPMLTHDQALSRRSRPFRRKDRVSKSDINTLTSYRDSPPIRKSKQMLGVLHPASRSFLNWTRRKGLYRNRVKSLLSMRKPLLGDVSKPGQLSLALLDAILIFVLEARFDLRLVKNMIRALP